LELHCWSVVVVFVLDLENVRMRNRGSNGRWMSEMRTGEQCSGTADRLLCHGTPMT
jgi:hypothetical protein